MDAIYINYFYNCNMEFKVQIWQCILTSDPIPMKKNKTNYICNKKTKIKT